MSLIYLANIRIPTEKAHGIQTMKMCEGFGLLENQGERLEVELLVPRRFNKIKEDPFDYYAVKRIFKIKKLPCLDLIPLGIPFLGFWLQSITFSISVFFYLIFKKTDIIYSRDLLPLFLLYFLRRKIIYEAHYLPKNFWLYQWLLKGLKGLVVITQKLKEFYQNKGIQAEKILVAPDGVDLEQFQIKESREECRRKLNLPLDKKIILYTGHFYLWKGTLVLAEAAKFLAGDCLVVFVGGTEKENEKFRIRTKEFNNILIVRYQPHKEIPYWLRAADVLVLPNSGKQKISQFYTSPLKLFEYMASQKPIIASDLPSIREILNTNNSFLIKPDDPIMLAKKIDYVLENYALAIEKAKRAFQDAEKYTWNKRAGKIINFFKDPFVL